MSLVLKNFLLGKDLYFDEESVGNSFLTFDAEFYVYPNDKLDVLITESPQISGVYLLDYNPSNDTYFLIREDNQFKFIYNWDENYYATNWTLVSGISSQIAYCLEPNDNYYWYPHFTPNKWRFNNGNFLTLGFSLSTQSDNNWVPLGAIKSLNEVWLQEKFDAYDYQWYPESQKNKRYELAEQLLAIVNGISGNRIHFYDNLYNLIQSGIHSSQFASITAITGRYFTIEHTGTMNIDTIANTCSSMNITTEFYVY